MTVKKLPEISKNSQITGKSVEKQLKNRPKCQRTVKNTPKTSKNRQKGQKTVK